MRRSQKDVARSAQTPIGGVTDRALLRELFVQRAPSYSIQDVLRLTRSTDDELTAALKTGVIEATRTTGTVRIGWEDVATLAFQRWTPRMVAAALDVTYRDVLPSLNQVKQIVVQLPLYQIRLLHELAQLQQGGVRARLNASDVLARELLDVASSVDASTIEAAIPGFTLALQYPYFIPRADDWATAFCRFCGRLSDEAGREMCDDCELRHQPRMHLGEHGVPELDQEE